MNAYAIFIFVWRSQMIAKKRPSHFDDRVGPLGLCAAVVTALVAIFLVSLIDFVQYMSGGDAPAPGPSPAPEPSPSVLLTSNPIAGLLGVAGGEGPVAAAMGVLPTA